MNNVFISVSKDVPRIAPRDKEVIFADEIIAGRITGNDIIAKIELFELAFEINADRIVNDEAIAAPPSKCPQIK